MSKCANRRACLHEAAQEQRGRHRAGERPVGDVVHVGDRAVQARLIAAPERHAPHRIADAQSGGGDRRRRTCRRRCRAAAGPGPAPRARRRSGWRSSCSVSGRSSSASARASASTRRPSASVLPISTVLPARLVSTSPGRKALPEMLFSAAGISTRRRTSSPLAITHVRQRQRGGRAAHVLLHEQHAARRLDVEAAGVEADALADQRDAAARRRAAPGQVDQARRRGCWPARRRGSWGNSAPAGRRRRCW